MSTHSTILDFMRSRNTRPLITSPTVRPDGTIDMTTQCRHPETLIQASTYCFTDRSCQKRGKINLVAYAIAKELGDRNPWTQLRGTVWFMSRDKKTGSLKMIPHEKFELMRIMYVVMRDHKEAAFEGWLSVLQNESTYQFSRGFIAARRRRKKRKWSSGKHKKKKRKRSLTRHRKQLPYIVQKSAVIGKVICAYSRKDNVCGAIADLDRQTVKIYLC